MKRYRVGGTGTIFAPLTVEETSAGAATRDDAVLEYIQDRNREAADHAEAAEYALSQSRKAEALLVAAKCGTEEDAAYDRRDEDWVREAEGVIASLGESGAAILQEHAVFSVICSVLGSEEAVEDVYNRLGLSARSREAKP